jgi:hypothetical protein
VIGAGGVLLLVAMLLTPWYTLTLTSGGAGPTFYIPQQVDGWNGLSHARWLLLATILLALAAVFFQAQRRAPALPATLCVLASILAGFTVIWLIVRVLIAPPGGRGIGGWLGLLGALAIAYGGCASMRREGIHPADAPTEIPTIDLATKPAR